MISFAPAEGMLNQSFGDLLWHLRRLRRARIDGKLIFVLGSGINKSYRLPDWRELLERLLRDCGRVRDGSGLASQLSNQLQRIVPDPLIQGAVVRQGYRRPQLWVEAIRRQIQELDDFPAKDPNKPLYRIADLVMSQFETDRHRHVPVLTFNYDSLLETALFARAQPRDHPWIRSICQERDYMASIHSAGVFVHHLHGYAHDDDSPIFDAASYLRVLGSPGRHWSWDCLAANLIQRGSGTMFIGLSLTDPSLRLLLTHWSDKGLPLSGFFVSAPPPVPPRRLEDQLPHLVRLLDSELGKLLPEPHHVSVREEVIRGLEAMDFNERLHLAHSTRDLARLFDAVLEKLSLIPYHVTVWDEVNDLLEVIAFNEQFSSVPSGSPR